MGHRDTLERVTGFVVGLAWRVILIALLVYGLTNGIRLAYSYGHGLMYDHAMAVEGDPEEEFVISEDQSAEDIAEALLKKRFIDNVDAFKVQSLLYEAKYVPGSYSISRSMTTSEIIQYLTQEGAKYQELQDKNLMDMDASQAVDEIETDANGVEVIGGSDDENMIAQDAANAAYESQLAESAASSAGQ
jgi:cell division protein YceG involved in septum cleavage